jgi:DNA-binding response OmpR family regulator
LVLVAEDDDQVRDLVIRILRNNGYRATDLAEDSPDTVELHGVSLVITDVVMRGRSGPALAARLRSRRPDLRVLFMSGYSDHEVRRKHGIGLGTPIVQKPFTAVELLAAVRETISAAHANGA